MQQLQNTQNHTGKIEIIYRLLSTPGFKHNNGGHISQNYSSSSFCSNMSSIYF